MSLKPASLTNWMAWLIGQRYQGESRLVDFSQKENEAGVFLARIFQSLTVTQKQYFLVGYLVAAW